MAETVGVMLSDLYTRFSVGRRKDEAPGGDISDQACLLSLTPHAKFAKSAINKICQGEAIGKQNTVGSGSGYGRYARFEFWSQTPDAIKESAGDVDFKGQWHTPTKYTDLIRELFASIGKGEQIRTQEINVVKFPHPGEPGAFCYFILDGVHRASFIYALGGGDRQVMVTCVGSQKDESWCTGEYIHCVDWPEVVGVVTSTNGLEDMAPRIFDMSEPHNI